MTGILYKDLTIEECLKFYELIDKHEPFLKERCFTQEQKDFMAHMLGVNWYQVAHNTDQGSVNLIRKNRSLRKYMLSYDINFKTLGLTHTNISTPEVRKAYIKLIKDWLQYEIVRTS